MPPKESPKYLQNSNYSLSLGDNYVASFQDKIALGRVEQDPANGKLRFGKRAIFLPQTVFKNFSECLRRAFQIFQDHEEDSDIANTGFSKLLYKYTKVHHVYASFGKFEDGDPCFLITTKWFFRQDRQYEKLVASGQADQINSEGLDGRDFLWLKKGDFLPKNEVEILHSQWQTILEHSFYENSLKRECF